MRAAPPSNGAGDVHAQTRLWADVPDEMPDPVLRPEDDGLAHGQLRGGTRLTSRLRDGGERAPHRYECGPAVGVRVIEVAGADRPDDDARFDITVARDRDLHLARVLARREREVGRHAAVIELAAVEHPLEGARRELGAIVIAGLGKTVRQEAEDAAMIGVRLDGALIHVQLEVVSSSSSSTSSASACCSASLRSAIFTPRAPSFSGPRSSCAFGKSLVSSSPM